MMVIKLSTLVFVII